MGIGSNLARKVEAPVIEPALSKPRLELVARSQDPLAELFMRKPVRQHVKEFGQILAIVGLLIALYFAWKGKSLADVGALAAASVVLVALCLWTPKLMVPVWRGWMKLGGFLEVVMTWFLLSTLWTIMFIPVSAALRIIGIRVMDMTYKTGVASYWLDVPAEKTDFKLLERQF